MPKLTKRFVDALKPVTSDTLYRDSDLKGFGLRAKPSGARTWLVQYRNAAGRTRKLALGKVGVLTPEEARQRAAKALGEASGGADPSADRHVWRDNQDESGATIKMRRSGRMVDDCRWPRVLQAD